MRLLYASPQCQLTALVTAAAFFSSVFANAPIAHDTDNLSDGVATDAESEGRVTNIDGAGLPFALDSFNGLELRDNAGGDENSIELDLVPRATQTTSSLVNNPTSLANNQVQNLTIKAGDVDYWYVSESVVNGAHGTKGTGLPAYLDSDGDVISHEAADELRKRGGELSKRSSTVYLSLVTCSRPTTNTTGAEGDFPQLTMYVSTEESPGPHQDSSKQQSITSTEGFAKYELEADGNVYVSVAADNSTEYSGGYEYRISASIDEYYYNVVSNDSFAYFVDSDHSAALLVTNNLTQSSQGSVNFEQWMNVSPPYTMFAHNINDTSLKGLTSSFCAVQAYSIQKPVDTGMTSRGLGNKPKEQFYIEGLNRSSTYVGILGMIGNGSDWGNDIIGGGGIVWQPMNFTTKSGKFSFSFVSVFPCIKPANFVDAEDNCAVLFNLTFCDEVAYAVPSNPNKTVEELRQVYDNYTSKYYKNFEKSLQQIQCNTSAESMFSLAVNCSDCASEYRQWLCSVSIPRCADFTANQSYLRVRNAGQDFINGSSLPENDPLRWSVITNQSRNPIIDSEIKPGPYKEILPCNYICHDMVKSCPAALGFSCPTGYWMNASYGYKDSNGDITCSYLGAAYYLSLGAKLGVWGSVYMLIGMWSAWWLIL